MTTQRSFDDIQKEAERTAQEAKFKVKGNRVVIELDTGIVQITNLGNSAEVHVFANGGLWVSLIHSSSNVFRIVPLSSKAMSS